MKANEVKKAVVLAAGTGTRLRPLTETQPKPLLPVWGEPMLERILVMLESWGVTEIAVNAHYLADQIRTWCAAREGEAKIIISEEKEILGTGGVLNPLKSFLGQDPFWLVNGDIVIEDLEPQPLCDAFEANGRYAACWVAETGPRTVEMDPEGRICNFRSDDSGAPGTFTYCGVALLGPKIFETVEPTGFSSLVQVYEKAMYEKGRFVTGVIEREAFWWDAGTCERYREVNAGPQPAVLYREPRIASLITALGWQKTDAGAEFLSSRGSNRAFWRLDLPSGETAIAVLYDAKARPENARYAEADRLLAEAGVSVPRILADLPGDSALALEECAGGSLEDRVAVTRDNAACIKLYLPVMQALARFHTKGTELALAQNLALEPAFGPELYQWEQGLFAKHCAGERYAVDVLSKEVEADYETVRRVLGEARPVLVHRDFQCANVLYRKGGDQPVLIDFQGMRLGPAAYDVASILYDPYAGLDEKVRAELLKAYCLAAPDLAEETRRILPFAAVERLTQALGAFGRLASVGQPQFVKYTGRALAGLLSAADEADLDAIGGLAEDFLAKEEIRLGHFTHTVEDRDEKAEHGTCTCGHHHEA